MEELRINFSGRGIRDNIAELEARLETLTGCDAESRAAVTAALAIALVEVDAGRARQLAGELLAQTSRDPGSAGHAAALVSAGIVFGGPEDSVERLDQAQQALSISVELEVRSIAEPAWFLLLGALAEVGDFARIDRELSHKFTSLGPFQDLLDGRHATWIRAMRATADGRAEDAEQLAGYGYELALAAGDPDAETVLRGQLAVIRWLQGRTEELVAPLLEARQRFPNEPVWQAALAWVWFTQGTVAPVTDMLKGLTGISEFTRDRNWLAAATITAEVAADAGPLGLVRELYDVLAPYSDRLAMIGHGITCWGTVARPLARLAKRLGHDAAAEDYLREAIATCARLGAQVWLAEAQLELSRLLRARGDDTGEARSLALEAATLAHRIGPPSIEVPARRLLQQLTARAEPSTASDPAATEPGGSGRAPRAPQVWMLGRFRVTDVRGEPVVWRSRKAELVLKVLVSRRGTLIPREQLLDFVWPGRDPASLANRFAVAISTVRRALDPERQFAHDHFLEIDSGLVLIRYDRLVSDSEYFLGRAEREIRSSTDRMSGGLTATIQQCATIRDTLELADEPAFAGERDALWAERMRRDIDATYSELAHLFARELREQRDWGRAGEVYRRLLELDVYDEPAHAGLVDCLTGVGAHGQAREAQDHAHRVLGEIGIQPASGTR